MGIPLTSELKFLWRHQTSNYPIFCVIKNATFYVHEEKRGSTQIYSRFFPPWNVQKFQLCMPNPKISTPSNKHPLKFYLGIIESIIYFWATSRYAICMPWSHATKSQIIRMSICWNLECEHLAELLVSEAGPHELAHRDLAVRVLRTGGRHRAARFLIQNM